MFSQASSTNGSHLYPTEEEVLTQESVPFTDAERNAMRAYLQRMEVRMSTLHRVATAFVGGAGLLLLTPIFFKEVVDGLIAVILDNLTLPFDQLAPLLNVGLSLLLFGTLAYLIVLSLSIPMYSLYLLIKDIVHFYFTIYSPGFSPELVTPAFSLAATSFSPDESPRAKDEVLRYQYVSRHMDFMLPFSEAKRRAYLDKLYEATNGTIIPTSRAQALHNLQTSLSEIDVQRFNTALGLARMQDRPLVQEVAVTEMLLVRNIIYLRRLVLRYVKALSMFLWTTLISFLMLPFLKDARMPVFVIFSGGYLIWALGVLPIIRQPLHWIYRHRHDEDVATEHVDEQLIVLERRVEIFCQVGIAVAVLAFILSLLTL